MLLLSMWLRKSPKISRWASKNKRRQTRVKWRRGENPTISGASISQPKEQITTESPIRTVFALRGMQETPATITSPIWKSFMIHVWKLRSLEVAVMWTLACCPNQLTYQWKMVGKISMGLASKQRVTANLYGKERWAEREVMRMCLRIRSIRLSKSTNNQKEPISWWSTSTKAAWWRAMCTGWRPAIQLSRAPLIIKHKTD